ncbi:hypothetical protein BU16DRAFT_977 [Lophium mytilinum]|uniref:Uncharacterized protein n=1 Tax=Lophium mytilinum TaxID=390894 RepID=A0A6A6RBC3_9PEZI|nr:hypothetical protein BU16DRAFT_977 [Lophium mytilinum]
MSAAEAWVRQRKWAHSFLMQAAATQYKGIMDFEYKHLLFILLSDPDNFSFHIENANSKVMCTTLMSHESSTRRHENSSGSTAHTAWSTRPLQENATPPPAPSSWSNTLAYDDPSPSSEMRFSAWRLRRQMSPNGPVS